MRVRRGGWSRALSRRRVFILTDVPLSVERIEEAIFVLRALPKITHACALATADMVRPAVIIIREPFDEGFWALRMA